MNNLMMMVQQMMGQGLNPNQIMQKIEQMAANNPQIRAALQQMRQAQVQMQQSGLTTQQYVKQYARQNNINLNPFMYMFNQSGINL